MFWYYNPYGFYDEGRFSFNALIRGPRYYCTATCLLKVRAVNPEGVFKKRQN